MTLAPGMSKGWVVACSLSVPSTPELGSTGSSGPLLCTPAWLPASPPVPTQGSAYSSGIQVAILLHLLVLVPRSDSMRTFVLCMLAFMQRELHVWDGAVRCMPGTEGRPRSSKSACSALAAPAGFPAVGWRPSRSAFLMSAAFHAA